MADNRQQSGGGGSTRQAINAFFEKLWDCYPRKEAKELARSAWFHLWQRGVLPSADFLVSSVEKFRKTEAWNREKGRFVPQLANWLRGQRWLDEVAQTSPAVSESEVCITQEKTEQLRRLEERMESLLKPDPHLVAAKPAFESFLTRFTDGQRKRGPAWALWSRLYSQGNTPVLHKNADVGVLTFLQNALGCRYVTA